ncbi:MAG: GntR family transcriptional regulator [Defluviitaleaceae bacterium]|nr:GntR family transcriptional regulator [Defluviitaleaceae bacterium]
MLSSISFPEKHPLENNQQYAYRALFQAIMHLDIKPGQQLSDTEVAQVLNISRTPVREAVLRLVEIKLVDVAPQRSSSVSRINLNYVDEGVFFRNAVESHVFKEAIPRATDADLAALRENLSLQRLRIDENRINEYIDVDDDFHRIIFQIAEKSRSWDAVVSVTTHLNRLRRLLNLASENAIEKAYTEHLEMYNIIATKSKEKIGDLVGQHISWGNKFVLPKLQKDYPDYFI